MNINKQSKQSGQAMISLLFILSIVSFLIIQATTLDLGSVTLANDSYQGALILTKAESYLENATIKFLRNPNYSGETLHEENISCTIQVVNTSDSKEMTAKCQENQIQRTVGLTVTVNRGVYNFSKIKEK